MEQLGTYQVLTLCALVAATAFFIASAIRHRRAREAMEAFLREYEVVCDDERIDIEVCETMYQVFQYSCRWCAAVTILSNMLLYKYSSTFRRNVDTKNAVRNKNLNPEAARKLLIAYERLFDYACYAVPFFGGLVRWLIKNMGMRAIKTRKPGIFLVTGKRITTPFRESWRIAA